MPATQCRKNLSPQVRLAQRNGTNENHNPHRAPPLHASDNDAARIAPAHSLFDQTSSMTS